MSRKTKPVASDGFKVAVGAPGLQTADRNNSQDHLRASNLEGVPGEI